MKRIILKDAHNTEAVILPAYGGMVAELYNGKTHVLKMNYGPLGMSNVLCGGIPILFPFAGKTADDLYYAGGNEYAMPMHGFAKDMPFEVVHQSESKCRLRIQSNEMTLREYYPFAFKFFVEYELKNSELVTTMRVDNDSEEDMPINIGLHPYFLTTDKPSASMDFELVDYYSFVDGNGTPGKLEGRLDLSKPHDHIFWGKAPRHITLTNSSDGYSLTLTTDNSFNIVTVYTCAPDASCIEPWQCLPNVIMPKDALKYVSRKSSQEFWYKIKVDFTV